MRAEEEEEESGLCLVQLSSRESRSQKTTGTVCQVRAEALSSSAHSTITLFFFFFFFGVPEPLLLSP
jgi:hypothetical protein